MNLTFDKAVEILEIPDISAISINDISTIRRNAQKRWHPDRVQKLNDENKSKEYESNFKFIDEACVLIEAYLKGTYHTGQAFEQQENKQRQKQWENTIRNAQSIQDEFKNIWNSVKQKAYKLTEREVVLSDGFNLKDLLAKDFQEDISAISVVSMYYGILVGIILILICSIFGKTFGLIASLPVLAHIIFCILGILPLSRFWLPTKVSVIMLKFINFGYAIFEWADYQSKESGKWYFQLFVFTPVLFAGAFKYIILFPLYEIAKLFMKDRIVGVVKQRVKYYSDAAEWYIEDLLKKPVAQMSDEELDHLFYLYDDLKSVNN